MFSGIIESMSEIVNITESGSNRTFYLSSPIASDFQPDQSISHNGCCLTVEEVLPENRYRVTAVEETLRKTNLGSWQTGSLVNVERSLTLNKFLDGHRVQGHVDTSGTCMDIVDCGGSWEFLFDFPQEFAHLLVEKGSIALNGISLTVFDLKPNSFRIACIPYTYAHTNLRQLRVGDDVNLEFDIVGKYIARWRDVGRL